MAGRLALFQAFPNSGLFSASFPNKALAVLLDFNGLQAFKPEDPVSHWRRAIAAAKKAKVDT
jgi:hypothetical protein